MHVVPDHHVQVKHAEPLQGCLPCALLWGVAGWPRQCLRPRSVCVVCVHESRESRESSRSGRVGLHGTHRDAGCWMHPLSQPWHHPGVTQTTRLLGEGFGSTRGHRAGEARGKDAGKERDPAARNHHRTHRRNRKQRRSPNGHPPQQRQTLEDR